MINIVAVHFGNYCGRGTEYLQKLFDGIRENLPLEYKAWCITDNSGLLPEGVTAIPVDEGVSGWWNKVALFRPGAFPKGERVLYFDLDQLTVGDLTDAASYNGRFAVLSDFYFPDHFGSAVMAWEAGALDHIWRVWDRCGRPQFDRGGDQAWIERIEPMADRWQDIIPGQIVSYKVHCRPTGFVPKDARIVAFHGNPRPHEFNFTLSKEI